MVKTVGSAGITVKMNEVKKKKKKKTKKKR